MKKESKRQIKEVMSKVKCLNDCSCSDAGLKKQCMAELESFSGQARYTQLPCRQEGLSSCKMRAHSGGGVFCRCSVRVNALRRISNLAAILSTE